MGITIGADPELFVRKGPYKVSAHDLLPGTKKDPVKVEGGAIQVDGTAAEFNIDPCDTREQFTSRISLVKQQIHERLLAIDPRYTLESVPVRLYSKARWLKIPENAKELGCDPDFNAYTGEVNPRPEPPKEGMRSGGGHIHVGWGKDINIEDPSHLADCRLVVKAMDEILFRLSKFWDKDTKRREIYGKPGAFRPKPYGVEYRVLSNAWTANPMLCDLVYDATQLAIRIIDTSPEVTRKLMTRKSYTTNTWSLKDYFPYDCYLEYLRLRGVAENAMG